MIDKFSISRVHKKGKTIINRGYSEANVSIVLFSLLVIHLSATRHRQFPVEFRAGTDGGQWRASLVKSVGHHPVQTFHRASRSRKNWRLLASFCEARPMVDRALQVSMLAAMTVLQEAIRRTGCPSPPALSRAPYGT